MSGISQIALISLGSNRNSVWGDPMETVQKAMNEVAKISLGAPKYSNFYRTPAFPADSGPDFVNAAMVITTDLAAEELLTALHEIEVAALRERKLRWGPRTLDIDLIGLGETVRPDPQTQTLWRDLPLEAQMKAAPECLIVPHPRVQDRAFVLVPLRDVAADWRHPLLGLSVAQMCAALPAASVAEVVRVNDAPKPR
jgi:2-amino-4-hydroxy-6-hydroxymethyldihydropteridine diphosphokinase